MILSSWFNTWIFAVEDHAVKLYKHLHWSWFDINEAVTLSNDPSNTELSPWGTCNYRVLLWVEQCPSFVEPKSQRQYIVIYSMGTGNYFDLAKIELTLMQIVCDSRNLLKHEAKPLHRTRIQLRRSICWPFFPSWGIFYFYTIRQIFEPKFTKRSEILWMV